MKSRHFAFAKMFIHMSTILHGYRRTTNDAWHISTLRFLLVLAAVHPLFGQFQHLEIQVADRLVRPGGMAQIEVWASSPSPVTRGAFGLELDPAVFGEIIDVTAFSAAGDVVGVAEVAGRSLEAQFRSPTGGIARLPDLPILTVLARIRRDAPLGAQAQVVVNLDDSVWEDPAGSEYTLSTVSGTVTVADTPSIDSVTPGGALIPAGTAITVAGAGFDSASVVSAPGFALSSTEVVSPERIVLRLAAPAQMTGKRIVVNNPDGSRAEFVSSLRRTIDVDPQDPNIAQLLPFFPLRTQSSADLGSIAHGSLLAR